MQSPVNSQPSDIQPLIINHFIKVPLCFQETVYTCGVACVQSILGSYGIIYRQDVLVELLDQKPIFGTDIHNIINLMQQLGFQATFQIDMKIDMLRDYIDKGITPILLLQAWKDDVIEYKYDWKDNHYTIACGYNDHSILFMDPYTFGHYTYIPYVELADRWHGVDQSGNHHFNCAIIVTNENLPYVYNPTIIDHQG